MVSFDIDSEKAVSSNDDSPIEQVRVTVPNDDDPTIPVWTFRMWVLGCFSCVLLSFINTFLNYRSEAIVINMVVVQVVSLPLGKFMAKVLPETKFTIPGFGSRQFSLNPGPFNMKEHVLISMFANAGSAFGNGPAYAIGIVTIVKAFYMRKISFLAGWLLVITTQVLGYGWAGIMRKYVVEPAEMWWPSSLMQVSLFRALHENDNRKNSRAKFFVIALVCSFAWAAFPLYLLPILSNLSVLCWAFPKSVTAQQLGSGLQGLGFASFTLDWTVIAGFLGNPLVTPFFAIFNVFVGYVLFAYAFVPVAYWGMNLYNARTFPFFSTDIFNAQGQLYDIEGVVNNKFELDTAAYAKQGRMNLSVIFALSYGLNFAAVVATITHVALFNGKEIIERYRSSHEGKQDIHSRLMQKYADIPNWWFYVLLVLSMAVSLLMCIFMNDQVQLPWWGLIFASGLALVFTLPISIITATTNQTPGLNVITEYLMGLIYPGRPIANVCFKTYGYISMSQAVSFLNDFKLGHYMKIPPKSMFIVQFLGTIIAGTVNMGAAWYLLESINNICHEDLLPPNSPWTCANDKVFYDASVLWGLAGPRRIFGPLGNYATLNWWFLVGAVSPVCVWLLYKWFPSQTWINRINMPVVLGATSAMPPASTLNFNSWILFGTIFNYIVFKYKKSWWHRYNYVLAAALDAGLALMTVLVFFCLTNYGVNQISWWGGDGDEHCDLVSCPTAKGVVTDNCPVF